MGESGIKESVCGISLGWLSYWKLQHDNIVLRFICYFIFSGTHGRRVVAVDMCCMHSGEI